jgi:hypothetical protein
MSVNRKAIGVAALGVACILVGASYQSWKGMLVAEPALTTVPIPNQVLNLTDFRDAMSLWKTCRMHSRTASRVKIWRSGRRTG